MGGGGWREREGGKYLTGGVGCGGLIVLLQDQSHFATACSWVTIVP